MKAIKKKTPKNKTTKKTNKPREILFFLHRENMHFLCLFVYRNTWLLLICLLSCGVRTDSTNVRAMQPMNESHKPSVPDWQLIGDSGGKKKKIQETYRWVDRVWECVLVPSALAVKTQESRWHSSWAEETLNAVTPEHMYLQVFQRKRRRAPTPAEAPLIAMPGCQAGWCCPDAAPVVDELPCWRPSSPKAADRHWRTADTDT